MAKAKASAQIEIPPSSLKQQLLDWAALQGESKQSFAMRLSELLDLSDSFKLSDDLRSIPRLKFVANDKAPSSDDISQLFLAARANMIEAIITSFNVEAQENKPTSLPILSETALQDAKAAEVYKRFYASQQSDMEFRLVKLRGQMRSAIQEQSEKMAKLVALDVVLYETLIANTRKLLTAVPKFVQWRFLQLRENQTEKQTESTALWLDQFHQDLQQLLLMELDVRLQPLFGLLEAATQESA